MKKNTKSSITLPAEEVLLVNRLAKRLQAKSKVEVIRRGLKMLNESLDREVLRSEFSKAARLVAESKSSDELEELDHLSGEGLEDE